MSIPYEQALVFGNMRAAVFYKTVEWKRARYLALTTHGNRCQLCGAGPAKGPLHVDHILPRSMNPDRCFDPTNLQVLCEPCHTAKGVVFTDDCRSKITRVQRHLRDFFRVERRHLVLEQRPPTQREMRALSAGVRATSKNHRKRWAAFVKFCCLAKKTYADAVRTTVGDFQATPWVANHQFEKFLHWGGNGEKQQDDPLFDIDCVTFPSGLGQLLADDQRIAT